MSTSTNNPHDHDDSHEHEDGTHTTHRNGFRYVSTALQHYRDTITNSAELVEYLIDVPFQIVLTIAGYGRYSMESIKALEKDLVDSYERTHKAPMSYAVSYESSYFKYANMNMVIACPYRIDISYIQTFLRSRKVDFTIDPVHEPTKAKLLNYVFKEMNYSPDCDWNVHNLDFYLKKPRNRKDRKRLAKHRQRLAQSNSIRP